MEYKLSELAEKIGAVLEGPDVVIKGINSLEQAQEDDISFLDSKRHLEVAQKSRAKALLVPPILKGELHNKSLLVIKNVRAALAQLAWFFYQEPSPSPGINPLALVEEGAQVDPSASIGPFVYIGRQAYIGPKVRIYPGVYVGEGAHIGEGSIIYPHAVIYPHTQISPKVIIHGGAVIGSDGFGYAQEKGQHLKIPHFGKAIIEEDVEIGANTTIDRATFGYTRIGKGSKIDNLVQIGHNVSLGQACILVGQVGIAGSAKIGHGVMIGGQAGLGQVKIGDQVLIAAKAGVAKDIPSKKKVAGAPAMEAWKWRRCVAAYEQLPELIKEIKRLRKRIEKLEKELKK